MPFTGAKPLPSRTWGVSLGAFLLALLIDFTVAPSNSTLTEIIFINLSVTK
jgi:hypothetical protein